MDIPPPVTGAAAAVPVTAAPATEFAAARLWTEWPTVGEIVAVVLAPFRPAPCPPRTPEDS
ncbi:hypothetical protein FCH28_03830 [Streptomyces piniterrae]|uniref:Uncharacterized protein n=1 Tax=Streptomyces piniterrae TaxID=2571125 RepID=A0A4U0NWS4_9ACTN|nr:hypothetical protein [Streptomyces piniterrae]TJZ59231.1 hypothetical protein FCH28_03830 [Streptomyces piniterrae]